MNGFPERQIEVSRYNLALCGLKQAGIKRQSTDGGLESDELLIQQLDELFNESSVAKRTQNVLSRFDEIWPVKRIEQRYDEIDEFLSRRFTVNTGFRQMQQIGNEIEDLLEQEGEFGEWADNWANDGRSSLFYNIGSPNYLIPGSAIKFGSGSKIMFFEPQRAEIPIIEAIIKEYPDKTEQLIKNLTIPFIKFQIVGRIPQLKNIPSDFEKYITNRRLVEISEFLRINLSKLEEGYKTVIETKSNYIIEKECVVIPILGHAAPTNSETNGYFDSVIVKPLSYIA